MAAFSGCWGLGPSGWKLLGWAFPLYSALPQKPDSGRRCPLDVGLPDLWGLREPLSLDLGGHP